jgi:hypothetical protein
VGRRFSAENAEAAQTPPPGPGPPVSSGVGHGLASVAGGTCSHLPAGGAVV